MYNESNYTHTGNKTISKKEYSRGFVEIIDTPVTVGV